MKIIKNLEDLLKKWKLEYGDKLIFWELQYEVYNDYLYNLNWNNDEIFLNIDKHKFCSEAYGYNAIYWTFPEAKDFESLFRLSKKIYIEILEEDFNEWEEVYVSQISKEKALENKEKRIFLWKIKHFNICINSDNESQYKNWEIVDITAWNFIYKIYKEIPSERKIITTDKQWEEIQKILKLN